jgi:Phosphoinositide phospholipase C, Ca2+-dependent
MPNKRPYDDLKFNEVQFKASHNSYHGKPPLGTQLRWNSENPASLGCRGLELDIAQSEDLKSFSVSHSLGYQSEEKEQFGKHLEALAQWSQHTPGHDVVLVTIDIKRCRDRNSFPGIFDKYISRHFEKSRLFTPGKLMAGDFGLVKSVNENGWPTLGEMRNKFVFVLSGCWLGDGERTKSRYATTDIKKRLCFSDRTIAHGTNSISIANGNRIFLNFAMAGARSFTDNEVLDGKFTSEEINRLFKFISGTQGFVTRGFGLNKPKDWRVAKKVGVNVMATDALDSGKWATVGQAPFVKRVFKPLA